MTRPDYCPISEDPCQLMCDEPCGTSTVKPLGQKRHDLQKLVNDIKAVVHERDGAISVTEAIGALEIAKLEIFEAQK